jgi:uncharacterized LabA/DUF88 family protein
MMNRSITTPRSFNAALQPNSHLQTVLTKTRLTTIGSIAGVAMAILFHQPALATIPLSIQALVASETNRHHIVKLQRSEAQHKTAVAQSQQALDELRSRSETELDKLRSQVETLCDRLFDQPRDASRPPLTQTYLNQILSKLHQFQRQLKSVEFGQKDLVQQVHQHQQQLHEFEQNKNRLNSAEAATKSSSTQIAQTVAQTVPKTAKEPLRPSSDRVLIFIDEANLYHAALERGISIDYTKLFSLLKGNSKQCHAIAYVATDRTNSRQRAFLTSLKRQGFELVTQAMIRRADGSTKGNVDLRLASELLVQRIQDYDTAVIISGDADFVPVVEQSHHQGKRVEVASFRAHTGSALIKASDHYLNLESKIEIIRRDT